MIACRGLTPDELLLVGQWEHGALEGVDWGLWLRMRQGAQWLNIGLEWDGRLVAAISFERISESSARVHVSSARRSLHPAVLRRALHQVKPIIFSQVSEVEALLGRERRAARILARQMGMKPAGTTPDGEDRFILTGDSDG